MGVNLAGEDEYWSTGRSVSGTVALANAFYSYRRASEAGPFGQLCVWLGYCQRQGIRQNNINNL